MINSKDSWAVALVHELCPVCCQKMNEQILVPQRLSKPIKEQIESAHGKAIGFSKDLCKDCSTHHSNGFIAFIEIDPAKSDMSDFYKIYRTGNLAWVKRKAIPHLEKFIINNQFSFIDQESFQELTSAVQD